MSLPDDSTYIEDADRFYEKEWVPPPNHDPESPGLGELVRFNTVRETDALAAIRQAKRDALEAAAKTCEGLGNHFAMLKSGPIKYTICPGEFYELASEIRGLMPEERSDG